MYDGANRLGTDPRCLELRPRDDPKDHVVGSLRRVSERSSYRTPWCRMKLSPLVGRGAVGPNRLRKVLAITPPSSPVPGMSAPSIPVAYASFRGMSENDDSTNTPLHRVNAM
jgi:hypothetical protein